MIIYLTQIGKLVGSMLLQERKYGTNIDRMAEGYAPVGKDGKPVQLHHLTQTEVNGNGTREEA